MLRELRDVDARWDLDVLRARTDPGENSWPMVNRAAAAKKTLAALGAAAAGADSAALSAGITELTRAVTEKAEFVDKFRAANTAAKKALATLLGSAEFAHQPGAKADARLAELERAAAIIPFLKKGRNERPGPIPATCRIILHIAGTKNRDQKPLSG